eukprot:CAMPEP_0196194836 /NCGR_PEP_ID=MMETSP0912-20130531/155_1 /TAXON_ID=49265 /ORGANISM="Thalassiosira rotula, Strain GSO102" /LENGTH=436 /DNA_ID=CAMNT_0041467181 /DNA_START=1 /DNA_END=1311 /DNA_ORIENTATION=-
MANTAMVTQTNMVVDQQQRQKQNQVRVIALASRTILAAIVIQLLLPRLLPHGPAVNIPPHHRPVTTPVDPNNASLRFSGGKLTKIYERFENDGNDPLLVAPETILFDDKGVMYIMNENAKLISLTEFQPKEGGDDDESILTAKAMEVADLGMGRPLGGKFDKDGKCLYYADVLLGLARICNLSLNKPNNNVELLASRIKLEDGSWSPINYADDVDIGPKTGHVYFSDASDISTDKDVTGKWDAMYGSKLEGIRGKRTGRLLRYRPDTGEVDLLAMNASFANGVAVDKDETYVLYTSTFDVTVMKYHLSGEMEGRSERLLDGFTGFLDGVDCSFQRGLCYVAIPSTLSPVARTMFAAPSWVRSLSMMMPRNWTPDAEPYGAVAEIYPGDENMPARILRTMQDPDGRDVSFVTGVTEHGGKLYLGSLHSNSVGVVSID